MKKTLVTILAVLMTVVFAVSAIQAQEPAADETSAWAAAVVDAKQEETPAENDGQSAAEPLPEVTPLPEDEGTEEPESEDMQVTETADAEEMQETPEADPEAEETPAAEGTATPEATEDPEKSDESSDDEAADGADEKEDVTDEEEKPSENKDNENEVLSEEEQVEEPAEDPTAEPTVEIPAEETEEPAAKKHGRVVVAISGDQVSEAYNGGKQSVSGYAITSISDPDYKESYIVYSGDASASRTDVGISYMGLNAGMFTNTNEEFENVMFVVTDGFIEVTPLKADVMIIGTSMEVTADGTWFVAEGYEARQSAPADMMIYDVRDVEMKAGYSARAEGDEIGYYPMGLSADAFENKNSNFDVTFIIVDGGLEIREESVLPEEPVAETPAAEEPTEEPVDEEPTEEPTEEPVDEEPTETLTDEEPTDEPVDEEPTETPDGEPVVLIPVIEEPADEEPAEDADAEGESEAEDENETDEEEFEGVVSSDAAENTEEDADAAEDDGTEEEPAEETVNTLVFESGTEIFDENGELLLTLADSFELTVLESDEEKLTVTLEDGTVGYIFLPKEAADTDEEEEAPAATIVVPASTDIRLAADGMSEILYTLDEDAELTILEVGEEWIMVALPDGTVGYIYRMDVEVPAEEEEAEAAPAAALAVEKKVTIFTSRRAQMELGEEIVLTSRLEGFEDCNAIRYQWECDKGEGFKPVEGANGESFSYEATVESLSWSWRLTVYYR